MTKKKAEIIEKNVHAKIMLDQKIPHDISDLNVQKMVEENLLVSLNDDGLYDIVAKMYEEQTYTKEVKGHVNQMSSEIK